MITVFPLGDAVFKLSLENRLVRRYRQYECACRLDMESSK